MKLTVSTIFEKALLLSDEERLTLAERLIASTKAPAGLFEKQV